MLTSSKLVYSEFSYLSVYSCLNECSTTLYQYSIFYLDFTLVVNFCLPFWLSFKMAGTSHNLTGARNILSGSLWQALCFIYQQLSFTTTLISSSKRFLTKKILDQLTFSNHNQGMNKTMFQKKFHLMSIMVKSMSQREKRTIATEFLRQIEDRESKFDIKQTIFIQHILIQYLMSQLENKIKFLVEEGAINISCLDNNKSKHRGTKLLSISKARQPVIGDFCKSIVIAKDDTKKQLILHLTYLYENGNSTYINHLKLKGSIRDYDLKQEFSIFTYVANFKLITPGTELLAQVRNVYVRDDVKNFELTLKCKKTELYDLSPGITRDQVDMSQREWKIYNKYGCFSATFLAQYEEDFSNPGLIHRYCKDLRLRENDSLNQDSLISHLEDLSLDFQRLIYVQEKQWADKHYEEGLKYLKTSNPEMALEHLNLAKSFEKKSSKIYIARGCALANLNNFSEGLKQIQQALKLSPDNKIALQYKQQIRKEMKAKESRQIDFEGIGEESLKKVRVTNSLDLIRKK